MKPGRHNILLVDDDFSVLESMSAFLADEGFNVKAVSDPEEAVALIRQQVIPFSLVMVDYHLEQVKGSYLMERLRGIDNTLSVIGFSGDDSIESHNESLDSGALMFVTKDTDNLKLPRDHSPNLS